MKKLLTVTLALGFAACGQDPAFQEKEVSLQGKAGTSVRAQGGITPPSADALPSDAAPPPDTLGAPAAPEGEPDGTVLDTRIPNGVPDPLPIGSEPSEATEPTAPSDPAPVTTDPATDPNGEPSTPAPGSNPTAPSPAGTPSSPAPAPIGNPSTPAPAPAPAPAPVEASTEIVFGSDVVYHLGDDDFSGSSCLSQIQQYPITGSAFFFDFEVLEDQTTIDVSVKKICGVDYDDSNFASIVAGNVDATPSYLLTPAMTSLTMRTVTLAKGLYSIRVQSLASTTYYYGDRDDFIVGNIQVKASKKVMPGMVRTE